MLLVDDDQADVSQRREDGQPCPHDDVNVARSDAAPLVGSLAVAQSRVNQGNTRGEVGTESVDERHGHRDLGDEDEGPPAELQAGRYRLDVYGGLAAAGDAVKEERRRVAGGDRRRRGRDRLPLGTGQRRAWRAAAAQADGTGRERDPRPFANVDGRESPPHEAGKCSVAVALG